MGRGCATRTRGWPVLAILVFGPGCGARTGLDVEPGDDGPGGSTVDVTGDGSPGPDAHDGGGGDSAADSAVDATLDSGSDATLDSEGDATPDSASDAPADEVASDAPSAT